MPATRGNHPAWPILLRRARTTLLLLELQPIKVRCGLVVIAREQVGSSSPVVPGGRVAVGARVACAHGSSLFERLEHWVKWVGRVCVRVVPCCRVSLAKEDAN